MQFEYSALNVQTSSRKWDWYMREAAVLSVLGLSFPFPLFAETID